ncbi:MAG: DUF2782 domain-containing protein [Pseudomonadales bacterium]|uniref:DUF2782 domain-containing protein n=1 Tax=Oleiphilus messinensis TaxID=141451 RepID=A0A1Y0I3Q9_9GAMM|nr:DUF2782 domain-containing protein [Oleiphilus messinensis]ARU55051.1 hypothetical protein OLMES_0964 [Oleiphilus messinensis]MCG8612819.1 DUF2782 domain-containing protein [Pseudomonadales bacterium]
MKKTIFTLFLVLLAATAQASDVVPDPGEPQITIRHGEEKTFYEYRQNGVLVEIKVVPKIGPVYYLVPADSGEGWIREDKSQLLVPSWVIFKW